MGQKVHPVAVRLQQNRTFDASWYNEDYGISLKKELLARKAVYSLLTIFSRNVTDLFLGRIFYQKSHKKTIITFFVSKRNNTRKREKIFTFRYSPNSRNKHSIQKNYHSHIASSSLERIDLDSLENSNRSLRRLVDYFRDIFYKRANFCSFDFSRPISHLIVGKAFKKSNKKSKQHSNLGQKNQKYQSAIFYATYLTFLRNIYEKKLASFQTKQKIIQLCRSKLSYLMVSPGHSNRSFFSTPQKKTSVQVLNGIQNKKKISAKVSKGVQNKKTFIENQMANPLLCHFENRLASFFNENVYIRPIVYRNLHYSALFLAEEIADILKNNRKPKKMPSKLIKKLVSEQYSVRNSSIGMRIQCSGRLGGAEMARKFFLKKGQTSLNVFSQKIDFAQRTALTKYGIIGIKVWISYSSKI